MLDLTVRVEGLAQMLRVLKLAPAAMRKDLNAELREVAAPVARDYRSAAPGPSPRGHGLASSITVRPTLGGVRVGSPKLHAPILEFGEQAIVRGGGRQRAHRRELTKKPALIPAVRRHSAGIRQRMEGVMERTIERLLASQHVKRI